MVEVILHQIHHKEEQEEQVIHLQFHHHKEIQEVQVHQLEVHHHIMQDKVEEVQLQQVKVNLVHLQEEMVGQVQQLLLQHPQ